MKNNLGILITGGDGYIGTKLAQRLLQTTSSHLFLTVRADSIDQYKIKAKKLMESFSASYQSRLKVLPLSLDNDQHFQDLPTEGIGWVVHSAAITRFNVDEDSSNQVNVDGSRKLLEWARKCDELQSFVYLSTVYASGESAGDIQEQQLARPSFANHYERSKYEVEQLLEQEYKDLPWQIIRIATIISDDNSGRVVQYNVFHNTIRLLYNGLISIMPGDPNTPLYLITGDFVAEGISKCLQNPAKHKIVHLCYSKENAPSLDTLVKCVFECFKEDESFLKKRILPPVFVNQKTFNALADNMQALSKGIMSDALSSISPFSRQLFIEKNIKNQAINDLMKDYQAPPMEELIKLTTRQLIASKWGRA